MRRYSPKLKPYLKKLSYSYTFGIYPTLDLLKQRPDRTLKVLLSEKVKDKEAILQIKRICEREEIPYEYNDRAIEKIAYKENTYAIGVFEKYFPNLNLQSNHIVLVEPSNMGNIGTIIRTMAGFGIYDLALIRPAADVFDPKVIRSAMGAMFRVNFQYYDTFKEYHSKVSDHNLYPFMLDGGRKIKQIAVEEKFSLIFGNEGRGLDPSFSKIGQPVFIPQTENVDSLNLSIAAGIAMWYFASIVGY